MNKKNSQKEFEKEIEILSKQVEPEELLTLGILKGFTRNDLKAMVKEAPFKLKAF